VGNILIVLTLIALAGYLTLYLQLRVEGNRRRQLSGMLISAVEKERRRIASELHDDFSQRLALLSLGIDTAEELIDTAPEEAKRRLRSLLNAASELGADLHTLSHRLHSSTLESLGLVPGINALCKEFCLQSGVEVAFTHSGIPRSVNPDSALCVFRIVQESLRNLRKHSSATKGCVNLRSEGGKLFVSVTDEGVGFSMRGLNHALGLGILSMEERANLLGGRLAIESRPGHGTKIKAYIPLHPKTETATPQSTAVGNKTPTRIRLMEAFHEEEQSISASGSPGHARAFGEPRLS
jgi:signal transduction histidine kinase